MNKLKFRAYNHDSQEMEYEGVYISISDMNDCIADDGDGGFVSCGEMQPEIMQWIGEVDAEGNYIYVGDYVLVTAYDKPFSTKKKQCKAIVEVTGLSSHDEIWNEKGYQCLAGNFYEGSKVLGNVWEHEADALIATFNK